MAGPVILAVDDEPQVLNAVERDLRQHYGRDFRVVKAGSGQDALNAVNRFKQRGDPIALFLVDQRMPNMSGTEFLKKARELYPDARKVLLTAYADTAAAIASINDIGLDYYMIKPWDPPEQHMYPTLDDLLDDWKAAVRVFRVSKNTSIPASPEAIFSVVSDLTRHKQLAGRGELVEVRKVTAGPMGLGSVVEANESIQLGDRRLEFLARSIVVTFDPPNTISWIPTPPLPIRRIQWWFRLSPAAQGTKVVHDVEVDLGNEAFDMFGSAENFGRTLGADMARDMDKTLENLRGAAFS